MKHTCKRLSTLLLAVCLLVSMAVPAVFADEAKQSVEYSFLYLEPAELTVSKGKTYANYTENIDKLNAAYGTKINSMPLYYDFSNYSDTSAPSLTTSGISGTCNVGGWIAIKIQSPGAGMHSVVVTTFKSAASPKGCDVYILPGDTAESAIAGGGALTKDALVGSGNFNNTTNPINIGAFEFEADKDYLVVFKSTIQSDYTKGETRADFKLAGLTLMPGAGSGGSDVVPDSSVFNPVDAEIAAENAVSTGTIAITETWLNPQNGHTYLYLIYRGGVLVVYDLNTKEIIDTEEDVTTHGRATYVDADGILWFIGNTTYLYRYDPYTLTCTKIRLARHEAFPGISSFNGLGITGDENGNIYFGTYNVAYLIKYDPKTNTFTNLCGEVDPNVSYCGFGGMIVDGGFIYADIRGMVNADGEPVKTHQIIKFDIASKKIVGRVDIYPCFGSDDLYLNFLTMVDGVLIGSTTSKLARTITVDTETMELINIQGMENGIYGRVSEQIGNKVYFFGYTNSNPTSTTRCLFEYDGTTATPISGIPYTAGFTTNEVVTIADNNQLSGPSILMYKNGTESVSIYLCNLSTQKTVHYADVIAGSGNRLREVITDPSGQNIWVGAYGVNLISQYNIASGTVTKQMATYDHQTDSLIWYDGCFYSSNYGACTITRLDVKTGAIKPLYRLLETAFNQERTFALTAGDGKLFGGTIPGKGRNGGVLVWYDLEKELTYVAAGPNPEDVYYARTYDWKASALLGSYTWYNAVTNQVVDFDDDNDGTDDYNITVNGKEQQRFYGLIDRQSIKELVYQNGYIYGITTTAGGSTAPEVDANAVIFVYDVEAMKVIQTIDVSQFIAGLPTPVKHIDALAADPNVKGKLWGVVCDTLFSFTFDAETATFSIQEELSLGKSKYSGGSTWQGRDILFDGDYMYVAFKGSTAITTMINKTNPTEYYIIANEAPNRMALGADDNLYFINFDSLDLMVLKIADQTASVKDSSEAVAVQAMINALDDGANIALEDKAAIVAARAAYDNLTEGGKALVTDISKLTAAESALKTLESTTATTPTPTPTPTPAPSSPVVIVVLIVLGVVILAAIAVFVIKKKRK